MDMSRSIRTLVTALLAFLVVLAPGGALAHDELLSSEPADGATVEAPEELVLSFSGNIAQVGAQLQITGGDGNDVADGDPVVQGMDLVQPLVDVTPGDYEVVWRVTSSDGHPISGTFGFTVEGEPAVEATEDETPEATEDATEDEATEEATTEEATEEETPEATEDATEDEATEDTTQDDAESGGIPVWAWVVMGVVVIGLGALLARTWTRGRS